MRKSLAFGRPEKKSDEIHSLIPQNLAGMRRCLVTVVEVGHSFFVLAAVLCCIVLSCNVVTLIGLGCAAGNRQIDRSTRMVLRAGLQKTLAVEPYSRQQQRQQTATRICRFLFVQGSIGLKWVEGVAVCGSDVKGGGVRWLALRWIRQRA